MLSIVLRLQSILGASEANNEQRSKCLPRSPRLPEGTVVPDGRRLPPACFSLKTYVGVLPQFHQL